MLALCQDDVREKGEFLRTSIVPKCYVYFFCVRIVPLTAPRYHDPWDLLEDITKQILERITLRLGRSCSLGLPQEGGNALL
jgi:hypothetical protein